MSWWTVAFAVSLGAIVGACSSSEASPESNGSSTDAAAGPGIDASNNDSGSVPDSNGVPSDATQPPKQGTVCVVSNQVGSIDEHSFMGRAWLGAQQARDQHGWKAHLQQPAKADDDGFGEAIEACIGTQHADLIVSAGILLQKATEAAASKHATQKFQILDQSLTADHDNVWVQVYDANEAAFLAGYLAAAVSVTAKVATFGGISSRPVTDIMDGFVLGVEYYNTNKPAKVQVMGWDPRAKTGVFITDVVDRTKGKSATEQFLSKGVDIVMPVAGAAGFGAADAMKVASTATSKKWVIGSETDWTQRADYADVVLTSVTKMPDKSVLSAVKAIMDDTFSGGAKLSTLKNDEVGLGTMASVVSQKVQDELSQIKQGIAGGTIKTKP